VLVRQLRTLVSRLEGEGIDVLPVKGPVLAATAYGDVAMRGASGDLDLVVRPADLGRAIAALQSIGYTRAEPALEQHDPELWAREGHLFPPSASMGTLVEVHSQLGGSPGTPSMDVVEVLGRSERRPRFGGEFRHLPPEDLLLYLNLHAAQHAWSRLIWIADVAALLGASAIDWRLLLERAAAIEAEHRLAVTLRLAVELFHADVSGDVALRLFAGRRVEGAVRLARRRLASTSRGVKIPTGLAGVLLRGRCELASRDTRTQQMAWLLSSIAPSSRDRAVFDLPRGLGWLRWMLRPLRLLWRHLPRGGRRNGTSNLYKD
jgi:hypothetical protein